MSRIKPNVAQKVREQLTQSWNENYIFILNTRKHKQLLQKNDYSIRCVRNGSAI